MLHVCKGLDCFPNFLPVILIDIITVYENYNSQVVFVAVAKGDNVAGSHATPYLCNE